MENPKTMKKIAILISTINAALRDIDDREVVMAIVSAILDQWGADHDMTEEEVDEMFADMAAVAPIKHAAIGLPPKINLYEGR